MFLTPARASYFEKKSLWLQTETSRRSHYGSASAYPEVAKSPPFKARSNHVFKLKGVVGKHSDKNL